MVRTTSSCGVITKKSGVSWRSHENCVHILRPMHTARQHMLNVRRKFLGGQQPNRVQSGVATNPLRISLYVSQTNIH